MANGIDQLSDEELLSQLDQAPIEKLSNEELLDQLNAKGRRRFAEGIIKNEPIRAAVESFAAVPAGLANAMTFGKLEDFIESASERSGDPIEFPEIQGDSFKFTKPSIELAALLTGTPLSGTSLSDLIPELQDVEKKSIEDVTKFAGETISGGAILKAGLAGARGTTALAGKALNKVFPGASNLADSVRTRLFTYMTDNFKKYGEGLERILSRVSGKGGKSTVDTGSQITKIQNILRKQGVLNEKLEKIPARRMNKVESQLFQNLKKLEDAEKSGVPLDARSYAKDLLNLNKSGGNFTRGIKDKPLRRLASNSVKELSEDLEGFSDDLKNLNRHYARFREVLDASDTKFDLFGKSGQFSGRGTKSILDFKNISENERRLFHALEGELKFKFVDRARHLSNVENIKKSVPFSRGVESLLDVTVGEAGRRGGRLIDKFIESSL